MYCDANQFTDLLTNVGHYSLDVNCNFFEVFPLALKLLQKNDVREVSLPHLVS
jgi:hypothetical protein